MHGWYCTYYGRSEMARAAVFTKPGSRVSNAPIKKELWRDNLEIEYRPLINHAPQPHQTTGLIGATAWLAILF